MKLTRECWHFDHCCLPSSQHFGPVVLQVMLLGWSCGFFSCNLKFNLLYFHRASFQFLNFSPRSLASHRSDDALKNRKQKLYPQRSIMCCSLEISGVVASDTRLAQRSIETRIKIKIWKLTRIPNLISKFFLLFFRMHTAHFTHSSWPVRNIN